MDQLSCQTLFVMPNLTFSMTLKDRSLLDNATEIYRD